MDPTGKPVMEYVPQLRDRQRNGRLISMEQSYRAIPLLFSLRRDKKRQAGHHCYFRWNGIRHAAGARPDVRDLAQSRLVLGIVAGNTH